MVFAHYIGRLRSWQAAGGLPEVRIAISGINIYNDKVVKRKDYVVQARFREWFFWRCNHLTHRITTADEET